MHRFSMPDGDAWRCMACGFSALGEPQDVAVKLALEIVPPADDNRVLASAAGVAHGGPERGLLVFVRPVGKARRAVKGAGGVQALLQQRCSVDTAAAVEVGQEYVAFPAAALPVLRARLHAQRLLDGCGADVPAWAEASFFGRVAKAESEEVAAAMQRMPLTLRHSLMPFQEEGVRFGLERRARCLIGDEMGTPPLLCRYAKPERAGLCCGAVSAASISYLLSPCCTVPSCMLCTTCGDLCHCMNTAVSASHTSSRRWLHTRAHIQASDASLWGTGCALQ